MYIISVHCDTTARSEFYFTEEFKTVKLAKAASDCVVGIKFSYRKETYFDCSIPCDDFSLANSCSSCWNKDCEVARLYCNGREPATINVDHLFMLSSVADDLHRFDFFVNSFSNMNIKYQPYSCKLEELSGKKNNKG